MSFTPISIGDVMKARKGRQNAHLLKESGFIGMTVERTTCWYVIEQEVRSYDGASSYSDSYIETLAVA